MKKIKQEIAKCFNSNKKEFIFLIILYLIGLAFGAIFVNLLNGEDKTMIVEQIQSFFSNIRISSYDISLNFFLNTFVTYLLYFLIIWILGISVIGTPIVIFMHFFRGFLLGFTIGAIVLKYKVLGLLISFLVVFPQQIIIFIVSLFLVFFSLGLSLKIGKSVIKKESISFKNIINKYLIVLLYGVIGIFVASVFEVFLSPLLIKAAMLIFA